MFSTRLQHAAAALLFAAMALPLTWPLAAQLDTHIPGTGPDDNMQFLWNFWWMRQAWAAGLSSYFHTPFQFHPGGIDLVLHTHVASNAFAGATLLGGMSPQAALNLTIIASSALNGFSAYLLAHRATSRWLPSILAGVLFAAHPATFKHLFGHFGLYSAWPLALFAYALLKALDLKGRVWPLAAGSLLALVVYLDYYYFVYACAFAACVLAHRWLDVGVRMSPGWIAHSRLDLVLAGVALAGAAVAAAIAATGGFVATFGSLRMSLTTGTNVRTLATFAALWWLWRRRRPVLTAAARSTGIGSDIRTAVLVLAVCALLVAPVLRAAYGVWSAGDYVSQVYFWRTAPAGLDPAALVLGNPFNALWGQPIMQLYARAGMFAFDGPLWFGIVPLVLALTWSSWKALPQARLWMTVVAVFLVWSLGPYLVVFGVNTAFPLPGILLRYVPIVSNARLPARAVVFVCLGVAVLLAVACASSRRLQPSSRVAALLALVLVDFWTPVPTHLLETPPVYEQLARLPAGAVLEIPFGIRDSFGEEGRFDTSVLYYQFTHGKPIAGGYVSRVAPSVKARYHDEPVFDALLRLSAGEPGPTPIEGRHAADVLRRAGIGYVVVDRRIATPQVQDFVMSMPLTRLGGDEVKQLYVLD